MKMATKFNEIKGLLFLMSLTIQLTTSTNIDCRGRPFHCLNSTHFMICVDLGGGISSTIDDFVIPCPPTTVCHRKNRFECEFPKLDETPSTLYTIIDVPTTTDISIPPPRTTQTNYYDETTAIPNVNNNAEAIAETVLPILNTISPINKEVLEDLKEEYTDGNKTFFDKPKVPARDSQNKYTISTIANNIINTAPPPEVSTLQTTVKDISQNYDVHDNKLTVANVLQQKENVINESTTVTPHSKTKQYFHLSKPPDDISSSQYQKQDIHNSTTAKVVLEDLYNDFVNYSNVDFTNADNYQTKITNPPEIFVKESIVANTELPMKYDIHKEPMANEVDIKALNENQTKTFSHVDNSTNNMNELSLTNTSTSTIKPVFELPLHLNNNFTDNIVVTRGLEYENNITTTDRNDVLLNKPPTDTLPENDTSFTNTNNSYNQSFNSYGVIKAEFKQLNDTQNQNMLITNETTSDRSGAEKTMHNLKLKDNNKTTGLENKPVIETVTTLPQTDYKEPDKIYTNIPEPNITHANKNESTVDNNNMVKDSLTKTITSKPREVTQLKIDTGNSSTNEPDHIVENNVSMHIQMTTNTIPHSTTIYNTDITDQVSERPIMVQHYESISYQNLHNSNKTMDNKTFPTDSTKIDMQQVINVTQPQIINELVIATTESNIVSKTKTDNMEIHIIANNSHQYTTSGTEQSLNSFSSTESSKTETPQMDNVGNTIQTIVQRNLSDQDIRKTFKIDTQNTTVSNFYLINNTTKSNISNEIQPKPSSISFSNLANISFADVGIATKNLTIANNSNKYTTNGTEYSLKSFASTESSKTEMPQMDNAGNTIQAIVPRNLSDQAIRKTFEIDPQNTTIFNLNLINNATKSNITLQPTEEITKVKENLTITSNIEKPYLISTNVTNYNNGTTSLKSNNQVPVQNTKLQKEDYEAATKSQVNFNISSSINVGLHDTLLIKRNQIEAPPANQDHIRNMTMEKESIGTKPAFTNHTKFNDSILTAPLAEEIVTEPNMNSFKGMAGESGFNFNKSLDITNITDILQPENMYVGTTVNDTKFLGEIANTNPGDIIFDDISFSEIFTNVTVNDHSSQLRNISFIDIKTGDKISQNDLKGNITFETFNNINTSNLVLSNMRNNTNGVESGSIKNISNINTHYISNLTFIEATTKSSNIIKDNIFNTTFDLSQSHVDSRSQSNVDRNVSQNNGSQNDNPRLIYKSNDRNNTTVNITILNVTTIVQNKTNDNMTKLETHILNNNKLQANKTTQEELKIVKTNLKYYVGSNISDVSNFESAIHCTNYTNIKYADSKDCRKFYMCLGKPVVGVCPNNTVFSEIKKQCTRNLSHCVRNNQFHCLQEGRFSDFFKDNVYYICVKGKEDGFLRYKLQCLNGYHLNKDTVKCNQDTVVSSTSDVSISESTNNDPNEFTNKKNEAAKQEISFECKKEGKFPYTKDCRKYYECYKTKTDEYRRKIKSCSDEEVFDKENEKCTSDESTEC